MTPETSEIVELQFAEIEIGATVDARVTWTQAELDAFRALTGDEAPVHLDDAYAEGMGMPGRIVYGLLVAAPFSRLLGCRLPGALSVIQSLRLDFARPVVPDEPLLYRAAVTQVSPSTRSVVLELTVARPDDALLMRGRAQCGLAR